VIIINLLHLRVLIKRDRVVLLTANGPRPSHAQYAFLHDLGRKSRQKENGGHDLPYEFRALESVLVSVISQLESDLESLRNPLKILLAELEQDIDPDKLRLLLLLSNRARRLEQTATLVRDVIEELLDSEDRLMALHLTNRVPIARGHVEAGDYRDAELLLDSYYKLCNEIVHETQMLVSQTSTTDEMYVIHL
jgi:magnesium transporter